MALWIASPAITALIAADVDKIEISIDKLSGLRTTRHIDDMMRVALEHHRAGRLDQAEALYRKVSRIDPAQADSLHLCGMIAFQRGNRQIAAELIRKAIRVCPTMGPYYSNLGTVLQADGKLDEAEVALEWALALNPGVAAIHNNLGNILQAQNKFEAAVACFERALTLDPDCAEAFSNLGIALQSQDKLDEAVAAYKRALVIRPNYSEALSNLGNALQSQNQLVEAMSCYESALLINPDDAKAYQNLGCALFSLGRLNEALVQHRRAQNLQPEYAEARFSESLAQLAQGDFASGWRNYEARWQTQDHFPAVRTYEQPLWTGEMLASGRVLIWGEQGVGDEIMFAGLMPDVIRAGNRCVLDCDTRLNKLFARSFPDVKVISGASISDEGIAAHLPCGSLPRLFRTDKEVFRADAPPYLKADPVQREGFRAEYGDDRPLVGLAWHTNNKKTGRARSIDLSLFAPLFKQPDLRWISLQYGAREVLEAQIAGANASMLIDPTVDQLTDIDQFAAQISALDLVVTIDNSTAHLAGALGVPVWVLLPFAPDWRWLQAGYSSHWYASMRLFRQPVFGDWLSVIEKVRRSLEARFTG